MGQKREVVVKRFYVKVGLGACPSGFGGWARVLLFL
jgi:hypothetical protein